MSRSIPVVVLIACAVAVAGPGSAAPVPPVPVPSDEQERLLARGKKFAERGQIDLFVACIAHWKLKADDARMWEPAADLGRRLIDKAELKGDRVPPLTPSSYKDFAAFVDRNKPKFTRRDEVDFRPDRDKAPFQEVIQAPGVVSQAGIGYCLILSQGSVQAGTGISHSVVFANGDVTAQTVMNCVVIVCDGDVTAAEQYINMAVIVARGNITTKAGAWGNVLMAGGKVTLENKPVNNPGNKTPPSVIVEKQPNTLGITFFELSTIGLKAKAADGSVTIDAVAAKSACEKAGVNVGDVILEANGKKPTDAESLRRLLRDALAIGDATVKFKRGNDTLTVKVSLPE